MSVTLADGPLGEPWRRPLLGTLDALTIESEALAGNALGDSPRRPLYVYRSPGVGLVGEEDTPFVYDVPAVYVLQGYTGQLDRWLARQAFEPTIFERLDAVFAARDLPPAVVVFVDAWTSFGGSQFLDSPATGRYHEYLCDEIVPFIDGRYPTDPQRRAITGHSSGGYGAVVTAMLRPGMFGAVTAHAPDALFEACYVPTFATAARTLRDQFAGSLENFWEEFRRRERFDYGRFGALLEVCGYAAAYSPNPDSRGGYELPFDLRTGRLRDEVWQRWLAWDPVRMVPARAEGLRDLRRLHLEAGRRDEANLDLGAQALSDELTASAIEHSFELFDGGHGGLAYRYPGAIAELVRALTT
jgi:enterochelin esterase-like enzyme